MAASIAPGQLRPLLIRISRRAGQFAAATRHFVGRLTSGGDDSTLADELIDDRALETSAQDRFGYSDFAALLGQLATVAPTPANIAIYAPWGSGKTSLANLLARHFDRTPHVKFWRFDAFKFADANLRRHFLSQVAFALDVRDPAYHEGLYQTSSETNLQVTRRSALRAIAVSAIILAAVTATLGVAASAIAAASSGGFRDDFERWSAHFLGSAGVPTAMVAIFTALAVASFSLKTDRSPPSGDEEFDQRFARLVSESGYRRLVIFVDELDRCSPDEVVATLETMKTFLDKTGCVFIVAADQRAWKLQLRRARARPHLRIVRTRTTVPGVHTWTRCSTTNSCYRP